MMENGGIKVDGDDTFNIANKHHVTFLDKIAVDLGIEIE